MAKMTIGGRECDVYTMQDWERDGTLKVKEGQVIEPDVFWELCNSLPPHRWDKGVFQPGEAYSYDMEKCCQTYQTFESMGEDYYKYVGLKP